VTLLQYLSFFTHLKGVSSLECSRATWRRSDTYHTSTLKNG